MLINPIMHKWIADILCRLGVFESQVIRIAVCALIWVTFQASGQTAGLVAAYGFNEGTGTMVADSSGNGNNGTISGATWTNSGKYGSALVFNGTSALVTVSNSTTLQLNAAMTLEAWVNPLTVGSVFGDVIYKGDDNDYLEGNIDERG